MNCNNIHCLWNTFGSCCPESEDQYIAATPNQLDCPSSLRRDHEQSMYQIMDEVNEMMYRRNLRELVQIHKYIRDQRPQVSIQFENGSKIAAVNNTDATRGKGYTEYFE